ncbi:cupredoxin domain-containing protein [Pseudalkalibacillus berkeleyi]|uniref:Cupredoxin domain-containing protein n=1 Tax=Pseudalkalibacillus berkeleyi TaxID=1069813 RepID=A0ABS9H0Z4_9BACL|nr:cupredoxin domain-containing protein [Pseudalkalibacillus berkeleyi]MCF6138673.1 cupredoxin domain-containing protein [Pseudalkalibacillus berkeleyi]
MFNKRTPLYFLSLLLLAILVACGSEDSPETKNNEEPESTEEQQSDGDDQSDSKSNDQDATMDKNTIEIVATEMKFEPSTITLKKGQEYEFVLKNEGQVFHDFVEKELDVEMTFMSDMPDHPDKTSMLDRLLGTKKAYAHGDQMDMKTLHMNAEPGQTVSIKFIPKETGTFEFYCSVAGHKEAGMKGTITVEE